MGAKSGLRLSVLGSIEAILDDQPLPKLPTLRTQGLLLYLAVEAALGTLEQRREILMDLFWPGMPLESGRKNLRTTLYYLRQAIGNRENPDGQAIPFLLTDRHTVQINPNYPVELDLARFLNLLDGPMEHWQEAIDIYQGDFLTDFTIPDANSFEEWAAARRAAFRQQLLWSLDQLSEHLIRNVDFNQAERLARRQLEVDNLRESAWRQLMESLAQRGRRGEALAEYEACVEVWWKELGVEPSAETSKLREDILAKKLSPQETISRQLSPAREGPRHNLPAQLTPFIGREREMAEIQELLGTARLVTLTGPGGTGKTRLGLQVAESAAGNYAGGVTFVSLAITTNPTLVPNTIARELGVIEQPGQSLVKSLGRYFGTKHSLLVLDNFEHVLEAAPMVTDLLTAAPHLTVMTISREVLRLNGEHEYLVPPLTVPDVAHVALITDLLAYESVALFVQRAQAVSPNFSLTEDNATATANICIRLDGLPLAIELAAARIKLFSPQQMLERLESRLKVLTGGPRDVPTRQRTLRDSIDWSYNLLDEGEKHLFARLAVFTGGRTLEEVEAVCAPGLPIDALDGLESLLNKSLLYQEEGPGREPRFFMLETIHEYASKKLAESGDEQQIRDRHLAYFLSLAEEMEPGYWLQGQLILLERTDTEWADLRSAFDWAVEKSNFEAAARLITAVSYFLRYRDRAVEGYRLMLRLLPNLEQIPRERQPRFLYAAGLMAYINGDFERYESLVRQALPLARESGDRLAEAYLILELARLNDGLEDYETGVSLCHEALEIFRSMGHNPGVAYASNILGILGKLTGHFEQAKAALEEGLAIAQETGEIYRQSWILDNLSAIAYKEGRYEKARDLAITYIRQRMEIGWREYAGLGLAGLAGPLARLGEPEKAARLLGASSAILDLLGIDYLHTQQPEFADYTADVRTQLDKASFETAWTEGQAMTLERAVAYALSDD